MISPMNRLTISITLIAFAFIGGCARSRITTEIKANGSWTRTAEFTGPAKQEGMQTNASLEDTFALPSGAGWKSSEKTKDTDRTITVVKTFAAGGTSKGDLTIKGAVANEATVVRAAPKRFEYRETLRWTGTSPTGIAGGLKREDLAQIKAALPAALATNENAEAVAKRTAVLAVPVLFGPGDPLLAIGLLHPDLATRRLGQRIGTLMMKALEEQFGDKLTREQRLSVARKLIDSTLSSSRPSRPDPSAGPPADKGTGLIPLMFILKAPAGAKLVSSNGEVDEFTGEVFWALFPEAASLNPVSLNAIWELK